jgi:hypothetical protein
MKTELLHKNTAKIPNGDLDITAQNQQIEEVNND